MRLLTVSSKFPYPAKDGGALAIKAFLENLAAIGHNIDFVAVETPKHPAKEIPAIKNINFHTVFVDTTINAKDALLNFLFSSEPYIAVRFYSDGLKKKIKELITANAYDIVFLEGLYTAYLTGFIKELCNCPVIVRAHNVEHRIWQRKLKNEKGLKKFYLSSMTSRLKRFEIQHLSGADFLLPITSEDDKVFKEFGINVPSYVMPFGIDAVVEEPPLPDNTSMAFIGSLDWMPNVEGLIWFVKNVWPQIYEKYGAKFYIAGRNASADFVAKMKNVPGVEVVGEVDDARKFILSHGIMLVPLLSGSGMRVKIIEAMSLKRAIVTTNVGIEGIDAEAGKHFLSANSVEEWIDAVDLLLSNPHKVQEIAINAYALVKNHYRNDIIVRKALDAIKNEFKIE